MRGAIVALIALAMIAGPLWAKLPAPPPMDDAQKAAAAAKAAAKADAAKKEAALLGKSQDMVAEKYKKMHSTKGGSAMATPAAAKK